MAFTGQQQPTSLSIFLLGNQSLENRIIFKTKLISKNQKYLYYNEYTLSTLILIFSRIKLVTL